MPFFIKDSSAYSATWFYMIGRLTQALGLLLILISKPKKIHFIQRTITYSLACLYTFVWIFLIYSPYELLPHLVIEGVGTTPLKNSLQYLAIMLQCLILLYLWRNFNKDRRQNTVIIVASVYLILGDLMFTTYQSVYDIKNFMGHFFQLSGFYFLMRTFYSTSVEKPFQSLIETQKQLKKSEESLHYMAYHDELTELPNSRFLTEKLSIELSMPKTKKAILMIEIDRLKSINESLGHSFIDLMLQEVATRLRTSLPPDLFISQIGRGEFTILLHSVKDHEDVVQV
jgi:predicted signal transduction protein with EAL and GGDEF domain